MPAARKPFANQPQSGLSRLSNVHNRRHGKGAVVGGNGAHGRIFRLENILTTAPLIGELMGDSFDSLLCFIDS